MAKPMRDVGLASRDSQPVRDVRLGPSDVVVERRPDGVIDLRSPHALAPYPQKLTERLDYWAAQAPDRVFIAARDRSGDWRGITYADALYLARNIGEALLRRDLSPERPIVILSGNDLDH